MRVGKMDWSGILAWDDGFRYEGELHDGRQHVQGTFVRATVNRASG